VFGRARLDGFAFDVEVLVLARGLGLPVKEVGVHAEDRDGSKVQLALDALRMLRDVLLVRRWTGKGCYDLAGHREPEEPTTVRHHGAGVGQPSQLG
jgi:dolichyl-phosphate beta-glucosyltransferase